MIATYHFSYGANMGQSTKTAIEIQAIETLQQTPEQILEQKRESIREIARKLGPEALADFERQFGKKQEKRV